MRWIGFFLLDTAYQGYTMLLLIADFFLGSYNKGENSFILTGQWSGDQQGDESCWNVPV
jgi:hypothetical protein